MPSCKPVLGNSHHKGKTVSISLWLLSVFRSYCYLYACYYHFKLCLFILCYLCRTIAVVATVICWLYPTLNKFYLILTWGDLLPTARVHIRLTSSFVESIWVSQAKTIIKFYTTWRRRTRSRHGNRSVTNISNDKGLKHCAWNKMAAFLDGIFKCICLNENRYNMIR